MFDEEEDEHDPDSRTIALSKPVFATHSSAMSFQSNCNLYHLNNYTFGTKSARPTKDQGKRWERMRQKFESEGMRRSVDAILLVQDHNHPHVLLLKVSETYFKLPGGKLKPDECDSDGLRRKLADLLSPASSGKQDWEIGEVLSVWWRPNYENMMYPYTPAHITRPKECRKLYLVPLPEKAKFAVPDNVNLLAVPLYELYDHHSRYGPGIASIPTILSRFHFYYM
eukprot:TRINITY_DN8753_c0_g1::TRINITY_DN8753_c0_g1_i1::g.23941::m.23941 TRINITY_DN8753_c0_g1::TRINITY_DN8753_c0_g1_i1::g.23941  ORF type:complete len:225 (+),score=1.31,sp/Q8GXS3/CFIS2_ARATH/55.90/2e-74,NUDIX_2/PF13869.1/1.1e-73,NUDIX/PF00293.23/0.0054 TRINITY_DN8753_c0_g1_i1:65-739(+)